MQQVQVVFHIDELDKWPLVLANVRNLLKAVAGQSPSIEILINSKAVAVFAEPSDSWYQQLAELAGQQVKICACKNSLAGIGIEKMPDFASTVPVGVLELIEKQQQGWAYIKP